jgi:hypothetical protein
VLRQWQPALLKFNDCSPAATVSFEAVSNGGSIIAVVITASRGIDVGNITLTPMQNINKQ